METGDKGEKHNMTPNIDEIKIPEISDFNEEDDGNKLIIQYEIVRKKKF